MRFSASFGASLLFLSGCYYEDDYDDLDPEEVVDIDCSHQASAGGAGGFGGSVGPASSGSVEVYPDTPVECRVKIPADAPTDKRTVSLKTTRGSFVAPENPSELKETAPRDGEFTVTVTSATAGEAVVSASIADFTDEEAITFLPLDPATQVVSVTADGFALQATPLYELGISARLQSDSGRKAAPGSSVSVKIYTDEDRTNRLEGSSARAITSVNTSGSISALITAGLTSHRGDVWVEVCPLPESEDNVCGSHKLRVVAPVGDLAD